MPKKFCTYLTIYYGDKLPSFYIGSSSIERIRNGYCGSVCSKKYKPIWNQELKNNSHLFKTIILEKFYSRKNATYHERLLHLKFDVVKSEQFVNMSVAKHNGFYGMVSKGKDNPNYGKKRSLEFKMNKSISMIGKNNPNYGKTFKLSEETKRRMSIANTDKRHSIESRKKMSIAKMGKSKQPHSEETKRKISVTNGGSNHPKAIPVLIDGITYGCKKDACVSLGISIRKLNKLLSQNILYA